MNREEAIKYWDGLRKTFSSQLEKEENHFGRMHLQTSIDAIDTALSAIRQQELSNYSKVVESNDMFDEDGGEILNDETVTDRHQMTNADRIRAMSDMELAQWLASKIANLKFLDIEMSGNQLTSAEKAALTHDLYVVFGRYLKQPAEEAGHE